MADLIAIEDLEAYDVELDLSSSRVAAFIAEASAEVIDAAGAPILQQRSEVELTAMPSKILPLPGLPIAEIHSVKVEGVPFTGWKRLTGGLFREDGWSRCGLETVTVDYTHGLGAVPADIKGLVCRMVIAALLQAEDGADGLAINNGRLSSFAVDDYKESYATGEEVEAVTEMTLPERTRQRLAKRFGNNGPVVRGQL